MKHPLWILILCLAPGFADAEITTAEIKDVAKELACLCDTCPRRPLHECTCGWAEKNRDRIKQELEAGRDKEAVIAGFIEEYGLQALSTPPAEGFNLAAWVMPFVALGLGGFVVRGVVRGWSRNRSVGTAEEAPSPPNDPYMDRLEQELKERDA